jgi:hypothetical protein
MHLELLMCRFAGASVILKWCWLGCLLATISGCPSPRQSLPDASLAAANANDAGGTGGASGASAFAGAMSGMDGSAAGPADESASEGVDASQSIDATANGAICTFDTDCRFSHCVEGVCCESACIAKCTSCRNTNTGLADGKCAAVNGGLSHATDCTASDPSTCGLDGKCDGAGACRRYPSGTTCAPESCTDGTSVSIHSAPRSCDGVGVCQPATTSSCGSTRCMGTKCRTSCGGSQDCVSAAYCAASVCSAKEADGNVCSSNSECATGVCGGLCCAAGCTCPQQSPGNILKNAGFDKDTSGWTMTGGTLSRSLSDVDKCPYSGSLTTTVGVGESTTPEIDQCLTNTPISGTFNFGVKLRTDGAQGGVLCGVRYFPGFNCDGDEILDNETQGITAGTYWESTIPEADVDGSPISGANSVLFFCLLGGDPTRPTEYFFDQFYVSKVPDRY